MWLHSAFAERLRKLCRQAGSVAKVCRETGISRAQLDRYLDGKALPGAENTRKLCVYFDISERQLFTPPSAQPDEASATVAGVPTAMLDLLAHRPLPPLPEGIYFTYFNVPSRPNLVMRSATFIFKRDRVMAFRRVTGGRGGPGGAWSRSQGNHYGIVTSSLNWIYFTAFNRRHVGEPSLIAAGWAGYAEPTLIGTTMVLTESGPETGTAIIRPASISYRARDAIAAVGVYKITDPSLDPVVVDLLGGLRAA
ncbi:helix-turn-helix domain-containing protein [Nitratireductor sp. CAU 1489]|uniref:Helix-turn-helix domain-containing protein n=1 Tax=Nitratireductor arenosus TaxID=2682096 RepID=A0A844QL70_9HYPH|nr:helix-turn-helix domain-containing protein [Nitratireductor arenosus]